MRDDERAIRELVSAWLKATAAGDLPTLLGLLAEDVVFLTPGREPFGRDEFVANFRKMLGTVRIDPSGEVLEVLVSGDLACSRTRLSVTVTPLAGGPPTRLVGHTLSALRRGPGGRWVIARDANLLAESPA